MTTVHNNPQSVAHPNSKSQSTHQMDLLSWNCNGLFAHLPDLQLLIHAHKPKVLALQETHLHQNQKFHLKNYKVFHRSAVCNTKAKGGVLLATKASLHAEEIQIQTECQVVAIRLYFPAPISVCSIYLPPQEKISARQISEIITSLPPPFMLLGDFNAHSPSWGGSYTNQHGRILEECLALHNLSVIDSRAPTHFNLTHHTWSTIDLVLVSASLLGRISTYVHEDLSGSDHAPILATLNLSPSNSASTTLPRQNFKKTDWHQYHSILAEDVPFDLASPPNTLVERFSSRLHEVACLCSPKPKENPHKNLPWWTNECKIAIRERRRALKNLKKSPSVTNLITYKKLKAKAQWTLKQAKRKSWQEYVHSINSRTPCKQIWSKIRSIENKTVSWSPTTLKVNDTYETDPQKIADMFADHYSKESSDRNLHPDFCALKQESTWQDLDFLGEELAHYNQMFTLPELQYTLNAMRDTAPGSDNFRMCFLQNAPQNTLEDLLRIFNHIWGQGIFPQPWKIATILPLLKQGKNPTNVASYRPISLTSVLGKLYEKLIASRLLWELETRHLLTPTQCGFRPGRSTVDQLMYVQSTILGSFQKHQHTIAVFLDLSKAFDTTWRYKIVKTLHDWNFRGRLLQCITSFLSDRFFKVRIQGITSSESPLENGVPQGAVLSPTLFNIAINDIIAEIAPPVRTALFADDLALFLPCASPTTGQYIMQQCLNSLYKWSLLNGFTFSPGKSAAIHFCRLYSCMQEINLHINSIPIPTAPTATYLGLIFDSKLTWRPYLQHLKRSSTRKLNIIRKLAHSSYGAETTTLLNIYKAIIQSKLDYGAVVYSSACTSNLNMLNTIQHTALRLASAAFPNTPSITILADLGEMPLSFQRDKQIIRYHIRLQSRPYLQMLNITCIASVSTFKSSFSNLSDKIFQNTDLPSYWPVVQEDPILKTPPWYFGKITADLSFLGKHNINIVQQLQTALADYVEDQIYYTDGSKNNTVAGSAVVQASQVLYSMPLPHFFSVFSTELHAILLVAQHMVNQKLTKGIVCSDSLSAIKALRSPINRKRHPTIKQIHYLAANHNLEIKLLWIPSHRGIAGNELADTAAKTASSIRPLQLEPVPAIDLQSFIFDHIQDKWAQYWREISPANKLRAIKEDTRKWLPSSISRREEVSLRRLRLGHTSPTHSFLLKKEPRPSCPKCNAPFTVSHILVECPNLAIYRSQLNLPGNVADLLDTTPAATAKVLQFIRLVQLTPEIKHLRPAL